MKVLTPKDKLTAFVQACVDGGYFGELIKKYEWRIHLHRLEFFTPQIRVGREGGFVIQEEKVYESRSLADLIMDADAMKAAYGGECYRLKLIPKSEGGNGYSDKGHDTGGLCGHIRNCTKIPAWQYHAHKALDIIYDKGTEAAINYLYDNLGGKENE